MVNAYEQFILLHLISVISQTNRCSHIHFVECGCSLLTVVVMEPFRMVMYFCL